MLSAAAPLECYQRRRRFNVISSGTANVKKSGVIMMLSGCYRDAIECYQRALITLDITQQHLDNILVTSRFFISGGAAGRYSVYILQLTYIVLTHNGMLLCLRHTQNEDPALRCATCRIP